MNQQSRTAEWLCLSLALMVGCSRPLSPWQYDGADVVSAVMAAYDTNRDQSLTEDELQSSLPFRAALKRFDTNGDRTLESAEILSRVESYEKMSKYIVAQIYVSRDGAAAQNAQVTMQMSAVMGEGLPEFTTKTNEQGAGVPQSSLRGMLGFPPGLYDIVIEHQGVTTRFGREIADDVPGVSQLRFDIGKNSKRNR